MQLGSACSAPLTIIIFDTSVTKVLNNSHQIPGLYLTHLSLRFFERNPARLCFFERVATLSFSDVIPLKIEIQTTQIYTTSEHLASSIDR